MPNLNEATIVEIVGLKKKSNIIERDGRRRNEKGIRKRLVWVIH